MWRFRLFNDCALEVFSRWEKIFKMDPTSFGFVAVIAVFIIIISIIVFKMYPKETDFEKAYGENALRLLTEDRTTKTKSAKNKNKGKNGEKKKDPGTEEKENRVEKSPNNNLLYVPLSTNGHSEVEEWSGANNTEADIKPSRKKPRGKQVTETKQHTEASQDEKVNAVKNMEGSTERDTAEKLNAEQEVPPIAKVLHDENKSTDLGDRKGKKKNRARRSEEHLREMLKEELKVTEDSVPTAKVVVPLGNEEKKSEKVKPKKANLLKDISADKFQTRLSAITELEPEYITFITNYINNVNTQKAKSDAEIALMRKQIADKDRLVLQCTGKLTAAEQKDSEIAMLQKTLTDEKKKYKLFEQTVCSQMSNNAQEKSYLQRKYDQSQAELGAVREELKKAQSIIHSTPPPVDTKPYQQQIDRLKAELTSSKNHCSQLELELNQRLQAIQQMRNELQNQDCQIEHLSKTNALLEKRLQDVEGNAKAERDTLEMKLQSTMKVAEELSVMTSEIRDEMLQHRGNVETAVQEREKYCEQIHMLNSQLIDANRDRARYLNDCATYNKKLAEMEAANAELCNQVQALQNTNATNDANCSELSEQVEKYRKQLAHVIEAHEKDTANMKNELKRIQEEKEKYIEQISVEETAEIAKCRKELMEFRTEYNKKLNRIVCLEEELAKYKKNKAESELILSPHNGIDGRDDVMKLIHLNGVQSVSDGSIEVCDDVRLELNELKKQNDELRETNYQVVEISQQQEAIFKKHLEELKKDHDKALQQYRYDLFVMLRAIIPLDIKLPSLPSVHDVDHFYKWLENVENTMDIKKKIKIGKFDKNSCKNENNNKKDEVNLAKVAELEASNRRYRTALANLSSHIDVIEQEVVSKEKNYLSEISRLRHEISEQLKTVLANEHKRKLELISQASKLYEVINGQQKCYHGKIHSVAKDESTYDAGTNYG
uniref:Uncharacterized protein n=1 Tax=Setaria digitata TaxID=48799 RepID=A0A915PUM2_9BILA